jgi:hypothetical protein
MQERVTVEPVMLRIWPGPGGPQVDMAARICVALWFSGLVKGGVTAVLAENSAALCLARRQELAEKAYQQRLAASSSTTQSPTKANRILPGSQGSSIGNSSPHKQQAPRSASAARSQPHPQEHQEYVGVRRGGSAGSSPLRRANSAGASPLPASSQGHVRAGSGLNVPDFRAMHAHWQAQQAAIKAANRKRVTVPEVGRRLYCSSAHVGA